MCRVSRTKRNPVRHEETDRTLSTTSSQRQGGDAGLTKRSLFSWNIPTELLKINFCDVSGCISFFTYILYACKLHSYAEIYTKDDVIEIASELTNDALFLSLEQVVDNYEYSLLEQQRQNLEKEIASHAPNDSSEPVETELELTTTPVPITELDEETDWKYWTNCN